MLECKTPGQWLPERFGPQDGEVYGRSRIQHTALADGKVGADRPVDLLELFKQVLGLTAGWMRVLRVCVWWPSAGDGGRERAAAQDAALRHQEDGQGQARRAGR